MQHVSEFLPVEQKQDSLAPFLSTQYKAYSESANNTLASMRAITKTKKEGYTGNNPIIAANEKFLQEQSRLESDMRQEAVLEYFNEQQRYMNEILADVPVQDEDDRLAVQDMAMENYIEATRMSRAEKDYLLALNPTVAQRILDIQADDLYLKQEMAHIMEEASAGDIVKDVGDLFLFNDQGFTTKELANGNYFRSAADLENYFQELREIPDPEERRAAMAEFVRKVKETTGNSLDQVYYLEGLESNKDFTLDETLDKAGLAIDAVALTGAASTFVPAAVAGVTAKVGLSAIRIGGKVKNFFETLKDINPIKAAAKTGSKEDAAQMTAAAANDRNVADAMGVSQDAAQANYLPFSMEGVLHGSTDELSTSLYEYSNEAKKIQSMVEGDIVRETLRLTPEEAERFRDEAAKVLRSSDNVDNVKPLKQTDDGWEFEVSYTNRGNPDDDSVAPVFKKKEAGWYEAGNMTIKNTGRDQWSVIHGSEVVKQLTSKQGAENFVKNNPTYKAAMEEAPTRILKVKWDDNDISGYKVAEEGLGTVKGFFASPNMKFFTDRMQLVLPAVRTQYQQARLRNALDDMYKQALAPLGNRFTPKAKRARAKLDELLQYGDQFDNGPALEAGKVFEYQDLKRGITYPDGRTVKFSDNEIEAYYKTRMLMDNLHYIEDQRLLEVAKQRGVRKFAFAEGERLGVPYESARSGWSAAGDNWIYDPRSNRVVPMELNEVEEAYNSGYKVVKTEQYENIVEATGKESATKFMLVRDDDLGELPKSLLNYRQGYLPKLTDDGIFFVKKNKFSQVNGNRANIGRQTLGMFSTRKAAMAYQAKKREEAIEAAISNGMSREKAEKEVGDLYEVLRDREVPENTLSDPAIFGQSPFTGARSSREIFLDEEGNMPVRVNARESIMRAITHAGDSFPMSVLRHNLQQRWLKSAAPHLPPEYQTDFNQAINHIDLDQFDDRRRALEQTHSYIRHVVGVPSDAQMQTERTLQRWADKLEERGWPEASRLVNKYSRGQSATQLARTVTFHSLLGGFNMSQFIVQGLGSTVAMSMDPKNFVAATRLSMSMNALDQARTPKELEAVKKFLVNSKLVDADEIDNVYNGWRRSGLRDDLLNNADYSEFGRNWELTNEAIRAGTLPFRMGEAMHRRYTFANAYLQMAKGKKLDDATLADVMNKQTDLALNMSRMNKAAWQEGAILGVATQFRQVTAKFVEALLGGQFTKQEKMMLIAGQFAMFGFHGVPAGTAIQQAMQGAYGWDQGNLPPDLQRFVNEGSFRLAMDAAGMEDLNLISRVAIGESLTDLWDVASVDSLIDFMGGPFASHVGAGVAESIKELTETIRFFSDGDYSWEAKFNSVEDFVEKVARGVPVVDDVTQAYWYARGVQLDRSGRMISEERDISWQEVLGLALGFSDRAPSDIFIAQGLRQDADKRINDAVDRIAGKIRKKFATGEPLSEADKDQIHFEVVLSSSNKDEERRIMQLVSKALVEEPRLEREMNALWNFLYKRGMTADGAGQSELFLQTEELNEEIQ